MTRRPDRSPRARPAARGRRAHPSDSAELPRARKRFGQHFLEAPWVVRLLNAVAPAADDVFLEIGPGRGALTRPLAERVARVVAVEVDRDLARLLPSRVGPNVQVIEGDVLEIDLRAALACERLPLRVIGNLPYNISSPILFRLLDLADEGRTLRDATLMLQKEVADRLVAPPGGREYGALAIQVSRVADVERLLTLPPGAFRPPPKVTSAVVRLRFRPAAVDVGNEAVFSRLVRGLFLQRRKTLLNALRPVADSFGRSSAELLERSGVEPGRRPETLTLDEVARLCRAVL